MNLTGSQNDLHKSHVALKDQHLKSAGTRPCLSHALLNMSRLKMQLRNPLLNNGPLYRPLLTCNCVSLVARNCAWQGHCGSVFSRCTFKGARELVDAILQERISNSDTNIRYVESYFCSIRSVKMLRDAAGIWATRGFAACAATKRINYDTEVVLIFFITMMAICGGRWIRHEPLQRENWRYFNCTAVRERTRVPPSLYSASKKWSERKCDIRSSQFLGTGTGERRENWDFCKQQ